MSHAVQAVDDRNRSSARRAEHAQLTDHLAAVDAVLAQQLDQLQHRWNENAGTASSPLGLDLPAELREFMGRGGKRTRPAMVFHGWRAGDPYDERRGGDAMRTAAAAMELLHCFALVHDDVMDESGVRRGRPSVHARAARLHLEQRGVAGSARFGDSVAMLVGDLAHAEADRLAADLPAPMRRVWQQLAVELIAGQLGDVAGSAAAVRHPEFARQVARQKTGHYTVTRPLQLGALAAGADERCLAALSDYGSNAGEAFALRDDMLGVFGAEAATGKPVGDDLRSGKPTVLLALAAASLTGPSVAALARAGTPDMSEDDVRVVHDALLDQGVAATVESIIEQRVDDALAALDPAVIPEHGVDALTHVVLELARRAA